MDDENYKPLYSALKALYASIPSDELSRIERIFSFRFFKKGSFFVTAHEKPSQIAFVLSGIFRYYYIDFEGCDKTKHFSPENSFIASYSALLSGNTSELTIEALENSTVLICQYSDWVDLLESHSCWQVVGRRIMEALFIQMESRERSLLVEDAQHRYSRFLSEYPQLYDRIKQYHIASYLGISPVTLSRVRSKIRFISIC